MHRTVIRIRRGGSSTRNGEERETQRSLRTENRSGNRFSVKDSASFYSLSCPAFRANGPTKAKLKLLLGLESVLRKSGQPQ